MKFLEDKSYNWQPFVGGIITAFALIAIVFALPLKVISTETIETYYVTEMKQEAYSISEPYVTEEILEKTEVFADGFYKVIPSGIIISFNIDRPDAQLVGKFENPIPGSFAIITSANRILWETLGSQSAIDLPLSQGQYLARFRENVMWGEDCYIYLAMKWTEVQEVTKYKEITKYREVPVQIEKQRTIAKQDRISIWKQIFK
ncbi:MAG: hypothetical protein A2025_01615 [Chloroflexi bacterium RBG_19FT_COMBO_47_15]|nr:MAG: hypothetical protein A2025_01615 [Chloroflexi bacterium RBG_19FT_COMBO_47_15]